MSVKIRPLAQRDLDEIWDYIAGRWGKDQANSYVSQIRLTVEGLVESSSQHPSAGHLYSALRKARVGTHFVYFLENDPIEVVRILHERRHASPLLHTDQ